MRLSGANPEILRRFPAERGIYFGMATAILSTGAIAGVSMWFALHTALKAGIVPAMLLAAGWSLIIMWLDRSLIVSLKRQRDWKGLKGLSLYVLWASPRLGLAVLFGVIISTPITLQIFNSEINFQLTQMHGAALVAFDHGPLQQLTAQIISDQTTVDNLAALSKTGGPPLDPATDPEIKSLSGELSKAKAQAPADYTAWQCQLYGTVPGSSVKCPPGKGDLSAAAGQRYQADETQATELQSRINARMAELSAQSNAEQKAREQQALSELPAARQQLTIDANQLKTQVAAFNSGNEGNNGILERIRALNAAAGTDFGLKLARLALFLFFLAIDCIPVLMKILHNLAPEGAYEKALEKDEELQISAQQQVSQRGLDDETARTLARAEAHKRLADEAIGVEEQLLREDLARRAGGSRRSAAAHGGAQDGSWFRLRNGHARPAGPIRTRTDIQHFDPN